MVGGEGVGVFGVARGEGGWYGMRWVEGKKRGWDWEGCLVGGAEGRVSLVRVFFFFFFFFLGFMRMGSGSFGWVLCWFFRRWRGEGFLFFSFFLFFFFLFWLRREKKDLSSLFCSFYFTFLAFLSHLFIDFVAFLDFKSWL